MKRIVVLVFFALLFIKGIYAQNSTNYYIISVDENDSIYYNGKALKTRDIVPAKAMLSFSSQAAKAIVYSPTEGKLILSIHKYKTEVGSENLLFSIEQALVPPMEFYFQSTRGDNENINMDDFASVLQDNPAESDLITVYFMKQDPYIVNIPKILLEKDAYFALVNKAYTLKLTVKDGKLLFEPKLKDSNGQLLAVQSLTQLEFYYYASATKPYLLGRMKFESF